MKNILRGAIFAAGTVLLSAGALAGSPATPPASPLGDTITIEASPEWAALAPHGYADMNFRVGFSHKLGNGFSFGTSVTNIIRQTGRSSSSPEATLGYRFSTGAFGFGVSAGAGLSADPNIGPYYVANGLIDWKLADKWTWNVVSARYRNSFAHEWFTPKIATGFSYQVDPRQTTFVTVGYSWRNVGDGTDPDKINVGLGYRLGF